MPASPLARFHVISDELRRFILTSIPSVPYLEAVLLFRRMPEATLDAADVSRALYVPEARSAELISQLMQAGVVQCSGEPPRCRYAPRDAALAATIDGLAALYASEMVEVTHLIHDQSGRSAQRFADAFKLRKDR